MSIATETLPELRLAAIRLVGPYQQIGRAFAALHGIITAARLPHRELIAVFYDDATVTPAAALRSDAAVIVDEDVALPAGVEERRIPAGRYATVEHAGSYERLAAAWSRFLLEELPRSGHAPRAGVHFEIYRNTPMQVPAAELRTALYAPIA
jgi:AraC family transcriptional regulator